jgi:DNA polymerase-3 subunit gamma/tau
MSYVVLARKWRPRAFGELLGQEHITRTLTNAIESDRVAHAFLFSGPRGVGKTSAARILAKALCCEAQDHPTPTPCGACRACVEITEGRSTDVFEIDAASHTGVDNVREIIDNVRYLPSASRFKIYVIDEVHMLSQGAFNALLKTLEEPPPHVKFVLATTDVHKVPVTILSRVQRYDFRRIPGPRIAARLSEILTAEGREHDPGALSLVAREAEGSMRDAQSLLEQVLAFSGDAPLDAARVRDALGVVDATVVRSSIDALLQRDPAGALEQVREVYERGLDLVRFADALVEQVRDLLVARVSEDPRAALDRPADEIEALQATARQTDGPTLERLFRALSPLVEEVGNSPHPRFTLEIGLASLAEAPPRVDLAALVDRLGDLEGAVRRAPAGGGGGAGSPSGGGGRPPSSGRGAPARSRAGRSEPASGSARRAANEPTSAPKSRPASRPAADAPASPAVPARSEEEGPHATATEGARDFRGFVEAVKAARPALGASLAQVRPAEFGPERVVLLCESAFDLQNLGPRKTRDFLQSMLRDFFGTPVPLDIDRADGRSAAAGSSSIAAQDEAEATARRMAKEERARNHPAVKAIQDELGGSVARVRVREETEP